MGIYFSIMRTILNSDYYIQWTTMLNVEPSRIGSLILVFSQYFEPKACKVSYGFGYVFSLMGCCWSWIFFPSSQTKWCTSHVESLAGELILAMKDTNVLENYQFSLWDRIYFSLESSNLFLSDIDDCHIHVNYCNLYYWKNWWDKGNIVYHTPTLIGYD